MKREAIERRIADGESATLELKKSTGQLDRAGETLCAFLNGDGGTVVAGVTAEGSIVGEVRTESRGPDPHRRRAPGARRGPGLLDRRNGRGAKVATEPSPATRGTDQDAANRKSTRVSKAWLTEYSVSGCPG